MAKWLSGKLKMLNLRIVTDCIPTPGRRHDMFKAKPHQLKFTMYYPFIYLLAPKGRYISSKGPYTNDVSAKI